MELNPSDMTPDQLVDEVLILSEKLKQPYLSEARKETIAHRMGYLIFEYKYQKGELPQEAV